jgi:hypothetical protein
MIRRRCFESLSWAVDIVVLNEECWRYFGSWKEEHENSVLTEWLQGSQASEADWGLCLRS